MAISADITKKKAGLFPFHSDLDIKTSSRRAAAIAKKDHQSNPCPIFEMLGTIKEESVRFK
ncbi:MAG: hypothetical protein IJ767_07000 [Bacteroidaceae bacterium]|jgi:hypothetical protein|nr:hypothetical protein [Bacteroidaceae bacterium]MBR1801220.1 hypothetical protein [Bacteroidaceae bacterium]